MSEEATNNQVLRRNKPTILGGILGVRKSPRVEPQTSSEDEIQRPESRQITVKCKNERSNSLSNLNTSIDNEGEQLEVVSAAANNRYSFCCTTTDTDLNGLVNSDSGIENNVTSNEEEPTTPLNIPSSSRPLGVRSSPAYSQYNLPKYEAYPSPILLSCRSRFREKFIPPSLEQFNSNPDIPTTQSIPSPPIIKENKKSGSYDTIALSRECCSEQDRVSADSLARQALVAAQVLHLIPTEKARQRNFLEGRSASISLLGAAELEKACPNREVTIFVGSWNMNGQNPPKQMNDFLLPSSVEHVPDLVVVGAQEACPDKFEWEVLLQTTLGPSHVLFHSTSLGTLHLAVYMRRDLIWFCSEPEDASLSVRPGSAFKTKGAVAISFCLFGTTMLFVTSHLTAHQQKVKERVSDVKRIINSLDLPRNLKVRHRAKDVTQNFDCVYWCGDLNFRLSEPRDNLLKWINETQFPLPAHLPHGFLHTDQ